MSLPPLKILLTAPRGFCAGVVRAIDIVERALELYGAPVYVRHEIVHNKFVVDDLKSKGAIFVDELDEIPPGDHPVVFSAHGVPKSVPAEAQRRAMFQIDATCPLVTKVHMDAQRHYEQGLEIILIGHKGHPEVIGTMGQLPAGAMTLIETTEDAEHVVARDQSKLAYVTQTTLSVDDTKDVIAVLQRRFPVIKGPLKEDICYATTNRQDAVKSIADKIELLIVVGAPNSSNSKRLVEVGETNGCPRGLILIGAAYKDYQLSAYPQAHRHPRFSSMKSSMRFADTMTCRLKKSYCAKRMFRSSCRANCAPSNSPHEQSVRYHSY
jgi:4-hydroxy-3-methylbut-2-enyl diphosphate reductase